MTAHAAGRSGYPRSQCVVRLRQRHRTCVFGNGGSSVSGNRATARARRMLVPVNGTFSPHGNCVNRAVKLLTNSTPLRPFPDASRTTGCLRCRVSSNRFEQRRFSIGIRRRREPQSNAGHTGSSIVSLIGFGKVFVDPTESPTPCRRQPAGHRGSAERHPSAGFARGRIAMPGAFSYSSAAAVGRGNRGLRWEPDESGLDPAIAVRYRDGLRGGRTFLRRSYGSASLIC